VPAGVLERVELSAISSYSGACGCVGKGKLISDVLIFLVPSGVLKKVKLYAMFLIFLVSSGVLGKVK